MRNRRLRLITLHFVIMSIKICKNTDCPESNPQFYEGRGYCKKCHNKRVVQRRKIKEESRKATELELSLLNAKVDEVLQRLKSLSV